MTRTMLLLAAGAMALAPSAILAKPITTTQGWDHFNGPTSTGQPGAECGDEGATFEPGNASSAPGSAFNADGTAHGVYAGEQPQNSRNTASVSQYDSACLDKPSH
jgi:hypothetical protein